MLEKLLMLTKLIESKAEEAKRLRELAYSLPAISNSEKVCTSKNVSARSAELIDKLVDLEAEIMDEVDALMDLHRQAAKQIDTLENPVDVLVLKDIYLQGLSVEEVAKRRGYSKRYIYAVKKRAVHLLSQQNVV